MVRLSAVALGVTLSAQLIGAAQASEPIRIGFTVDVQREAGRGEPLRAVIRYSGPVAYPMAEHLAAILQEHADSASSLLLDLDSTGGSIIQADAIVELLRKTRLRTRLDTRVGHGRRCLSSCISIFMQGEKRIASSASAWAFHGACPSLTNVPSREATQRYLDSLRASGVAEPFLQMLTCAGYLSRPGSFWSSGYQLFHVHQAGIITDLLPDWQPEAPTELPFDPNIRAR